MTDVDATGRSNEFILFQSDLESGHMSIVGGVFSLKYLPLIIVLSVPQSVVVSRVCGDIVQDIGSLSLVTTVNKDDYDSRRCCFLYTTLMC